MLPGLHGCMAAWLHGCMAAWLHGCMAAWLHGCMAVWLSGWLAGCLAGWLAGCLAGWLHGWLAGCLLGITPFSGSLCWVLRNTSMPVRARLTHCHPSTKSGRVYPSAMHQHTAHSTQHSTAHTAHWFLGGKCLVLINTVFNASPTGRHEGECT